MRNHLQELYAKLQMAFAIFFLEIVAVCVCLFSGETFVDAASLSLPERDRILSNFKPGLMRIDFSITTAVPTLWEGDIQLSRGEFSQLVSLGTKSSSSTDFLYSDSTKGRLSLCTRSFVTFCGVEATLLAPKNASLDIRLTDRQTGKTLNKTIFIEKLIDSSIRIPFDDFGNGVEIVRAPADELPITIEVVKESNVSVEPPQSRFVKTTVFHPNDKVQIITYPRSITAKLPNEMLLIAYAKSKDSQSPFWTDERQLTFDEIQQNNSMLATDDSENYINGCFFEFVVPNIDGVIEIVVELIEKKPSSTKTTFAFTNNSKRKKNGLLARRVIQALAISTNSDSLEELGELGERFISLESMRLELLETIDPTNSSWYKNFSKHSIIPFHKNISLPKVSSTDDLISNFTENKGNVVSTAGEHRTFDSLINSQLTLSNKKAGASTSGSKNLLGFVPSLSSSSAHDYKEGINFINHWENNRLRIFIRDIEQRNWGMTENLWNKPLCSGTSRPFNDDELVQYASKQSKFLRLAPNRDDTFINGKHSVTISKIHSTSWEAYPIPIDKVNEPYILEIEYPANFPQKLAISIIEQSVSGGLFQSSFDFGFMVSEDSLSDRSSNEIARYTALFWPKTATPIVVLSNCSSELPAAYGLIRIYRAGSLRCHKKKMPGRSFGLALTIPDLSNQFSVSKSASQFGVVGSEDWNSFYQSIIRMQYYLAATNIDSLILSTVGNGTSLYPSRFFNESALYDGGIFLPTGGDPVKKDILSAVLDISAIHNNKIIPSINLNFPIPSLEAKVRLLHSQELLQKDTACVHEGIEWIGIDGKRIIDSRLTSNGEGPYYNILHPEVEKVVIEIIDEFASRYAVYSSFDGLAIDVGANGWLVLPDDIYFGMDDVTISRFVKESNLQSSLHNKVNKNSIQNFLFSKGKDRYRYRAKFIHDNCLNEWINWRTEALYQFYHKIRLTLAKYRSNTRLYLITNEALCGPVCQSALYPSLTKTKRVRQALRLVGLDPYRFAPEPKRKSNNPVSPVTFQSNNKYYDSFITLLRPELLSSSSSFSHVVFNDELNTPEAISLFLGFQFHPGAFFLHEKCEETLESFNEKSPIHPTLVSLQPQILPAGSANLKRFARTLAVEDSLCFFEGGKNLPLGQEDSLGCWIRTFKSLPNRVFKTWTPKSLINSESFRDSMMTSDEKNIQPLVVRYDQTDNETWFYFLNAAPFHLGISISLNLPSNTDYEVFANTIHEKPKLYSQSFEWNFTASPYDLVAIRLETSKVSIASLDISRPQEICGKDGKISKAVKDFVKRVLVAKSGLVIPLPNGDFEEILTQTSTKENNHDSFSVTSQADEKNNIFGLEVPKVVFFKKTSEEPLKNKTKQENSQVTSPIPGWKIFGPNDVNASLDEKRGYNSQTSLKLSSNQNAGGIICQPFPFPSTGRLYVQICVGVPEKTDALPLNVCLVGNFNGEQFYRRIHIGSRILERIQNPDKQEDGVLWIREVVLFDRLPFEGLDDISISFELSGKGIVWLDQIKIYKLAFDSNEQNELMKIINSAEYKVSKSRVLDILFMLDNYWTKMFIEEIGDYYSLQTSRVQKFERNENTINTTQAKEPEENLSKKTRGGINKALDRLKFW